MIERNITDAQAIQQHTSLSRQFLPWISQDEMETLCLRTSRFQRAIILNTSELDPNLSRRQLKERVNELLSPKLLFGDDVRKFSAIYLDIRN